MAKKIVVVGAGAWGGWVAFHLQQAGCEVILIDKNGPGNSLSGSGDRTRIIRLAYGGDKVYTQLTARSFALWEKFAQLFNETLFFQKEALWMFRGVSSDYAEKSIPIMAEMGFPLYEVPLKELSKKYQEINFTDITKAYLESKVAYLRAGESCEIVRDRFVANGGQYVEAEVVSILKAEDTVEGVRLATGEVVEADNYVFACGPWLKHLVPEMRDIIKVSRQEVYYFETPESYNRLPIWLEFREGEEMFYGIPDHYGEGFKFAYDERTWTLDPDKDHRDISPEILRKMQAILANRFPNLSGKVVLRHHTCVYENSPDGDFIIDRVPETKNAIMLAGSSGHGFKMGPAIGELIKDNLLVNKELSAKFSLSRFKEGIAKKTQFQV